MKILEERHVKVLVKTNRPYHFFRTYISVDQGVYTMAPVRLERKVREAVDIVNLRLYTKTFEEATFLIVRFRRKGLGEAHFDFLGSDRQNEKPRRSLVHKVLEHPFEFLIELNVMSGETEKIIETFQELRKLGYKSAYFINGDRFIIR